MGCIWAAPEFGWLEALDFKERETGIEPATSSLGSWHSTAELLPLNGRFYDALEGHINLNST
jgi:hypothetical protein